MGELRSSERRSADSGKGAKSIFNTSTRKIENRNWRARVQTERRSGRRASPAAAAAAAAATGATGAADRPLTGFGAEHSANTERVRRHGTSERASEPMADTASATATTAAAMPAGDTDMTSSTLLKSAYELAREERIKQYVCALPLTQHPTSASSRNATTARGARAPSEHTAHASSTTHQSAPPLRMAETRPSCAHWG
jgi:hypothetical protein